MEGRCSELLELAQHLKQERLFVDSERRHLQVLNETVQKTVEKLYHVAWIAKQQRHNLDSLIMSRPGSSLAACCQKANVLEGVSFVDGYKLLGFQESSYASWLQAFRENPKLMAMCLASGERLSVDLMHQTVNVVMSSVYGHCILQEDEVHVLRLLRHLMELQLAGSENPRRLLQHGSCAFSRVYKQFNEGLFAAKVFLTGSLHEPIMHLLMEDDLFLDIDPGKAAIRFPAAERLKHFGREGTPSYVVNLQRYRQRTISKLVNLTNRFIAGIRGNLYCFPKSLLWLVKQLYNVVMKTRKVEVREVGAMCADLVFAFFVCPAIVNPELYGICDAHISYIARFNLMQVAQILQVLAMSKWEEIDPKLMDLYGRFERDCMSSLLDVMLEGGVDDNPVEGGSLLAGLLRTAILITETDLTVLVNFLRVISTESSDEWLDKRTLEDLLSILPSPNTPNSDGSGGDSPSVVLQTPPHTPGSRKTLLAKVGRSGKRFPALTPPHNENHVDGHRVDGEELMQGQSALEDVLVISLNVATECPGMVPEHKILSLEQQNRQSKVRMNLESVSNEDESIVSGGEMFEKKTRFSISHDQDSIGNTSDNLEAVSEAASNHSVTSSLELENENENDNLSDMVSANVSGRGTPNVSGRDTPSSQVDVDERDRRPLDLPVTAQKQNREDINEKFGKFEIKNNMIGGDETISLVSDTWSTDVLASDSENVEQMEQSQRERMLEDISLINQNAEAAQHNLLDIAETASEAWSTDVLASDSERLQELDNDDMGSIARSDDTASVARSDDIGRSEVDVCDVDTLRVDASDHGEEMVTPRASGSRSPIDGPVPQVTNASQWVQNFQPAANARGRSSPVAENAQEEEDDGPVPLRKPHVVELVDSFTKIEKGKTSPVSSKVYYSDGIKYCHGKVGSILNALNPAVSDNIVSSSTSGSERSSELSEPERDSMDGTRFPEPNEIMGMQSLGRLSLPVEDITEDVIQDLHVHLTDSLSHVIDMDCEQRQPSDAESNHCVSRTSKPATDDVSSSVNDDSFAPVKPDTKPEDRGYVREFDPLRSDDGEENERLHPLPSPKTSDLKATECRSTLSLASSSSSGSGSAEVTAFTANGFVTPAEKPRDGGHGTGTAPRGTNLPPSATGAIPKSISFDKTAERGDKEGLCPDDPKHRRGFFKSFKQAFKVKPRKSARYQDDVSSYPRQFDKDSGDDILSKYRKKCGNGVDTNGGVQPSKGASQDDVTRGQSVDKETVSAEEDERNAFDPQQPETSYAFKDAKKKLRLVLSNAEIQVGSRADKMSGRLEAAVQLSGSRREKDGELVTFLKTQHAEAVNLQDRVLTAQIQETLRCVQLFDKAGCKKLFKSLKDDYKKRCMYIAYLVRCRQGLLATLAHAERLLKRIERDKAVCNRCMIAVCVRLFLEKRDMNIHRFVEAFQKLTVSDEKTDLVEQYLQYLFQEMDKEATWQGASEDQMEQAQQAIERSIMSQIYIHALYPNGDGDMLRDQLLHEHILKLSKVVTPNHKDLRIPKVYHYECPWPSAQAEIMTINVYKTPRDKLQCVVRCCKTIMNLLNIANEKSVPAADDFVPVLVFVVIKANPAGLLSTVQYVNSFYQKQLKGEDEYWWTQFCSAIEFIKTMDYNE